MLLLRVQFSQGAFHQVQGMVILNECLPVGLFTRSGGMPLTDFSGHFALFFSDPHQAMVLGHHIEPGFEILHFVFLQFLDHFEEDLLHTVFGFLFIFQVLHGNPQQQQGIPLQQDAQPLIIVVGMKLFQQFLVADMGVFVRFHRSGCDFFL